MKFPNCCPATGCDFCSTPTNDLVQLTYCPQDDEGIDPRFGALPCLYACTDCIGDMVRYEPCKGHV